MLPVVAQDAAQMSSQALAVDRPDEMSPSDIFDKAWQAVEVKYGQVGRVVAVSAGVLLVWNNYAEIRLAVKVTCGWSSGMICA